VVRAAEAVRAPASGVDDPGAAMTAGVVEGPELAAFVTDDDDRLSHFVHGPIIARAGCSPGGSETQPSLLEHVASLEFEELGVRVPRARDPPHRPVEIEGRHVRRRENHGPRLAVRGRSRRDSLRGAAEATRLIGREDTREFGWRSTGLGL